MRVAITKKNSRNQLACVRADGTSVVADLGPNLPYHDLAHLVVEQRLGLTEGFFGHIARGFTPAQLSDKDIIKRLGKEPYRAEILARALGSLQTGACAPEQFEALVNTELALLNLTEMRIPPELRDEISVEYRDLLRAYSELRTGQTLELRFEEHAPGVTHLNKSQERSHGR